MIKMIMISSLLELTESIRFIIKILMDFCENIEMFGFNYKVWRKEFISDY
jgi:hypothetical protein